MIESFAKFDSTFIIVFLFGFKFCCMMFGEGIGRVIVGSCVMYVNVYFVV